MQLGRDIIRKTSKNDERVALHDNSSVEQDQKRTSRKKSERVHRATQRKYIYNRAEGFGLFYKVLEQPWKTDLLEITAEPDLTLPDNEHYAPDFQLAAFRKV